MKRNYRVRRIAHDQTLVIHKPRRTSQRSQTTLSVIGVIGGKVRNQLDRVGKVFVEKLRDVRLVLKRLKTVFTCFGHEQCNGKTSVLIWQRDQHVTAARPNMQGFFFNLPAS